MTFRRGAAIAAIAAVAVVVAALIVYGVSLSRPVADDYTGHAASPSPVTPSSTATASSSGAAASASAGSSADTGSGTGSGTASPDAQGDQPTWDPAADAPEGADAEPKVPGGLGTEPYRLPALAERKPALTQVPEAAVTDGELAAGFPEDVIPVPAGAEIQFSSVSPQGSRVLVGLQALSDEDPEALLDFYAQHCEELGWAATRLPAADGAQNLQCGFGGDSLTVAVPVLPTGRTDLTATGAFLVPEGN